MSQMRRCTDCDDVHVTGADALRCDHERGIERWSRLVGGTHAAGEVRGCSLCERLQRSKARREAASAALAAALAEEGAGAG
jgi:hypothetical protein